MVLSPFLVNLDSYWKLQHSTVSYLLSVSQKRTFLYFLRYLEHLFCCPWQVGLSYPLSATHKMLTLFLLKGGVCELPSEMRLVSRQSKGKEYPHTIFPEWWRKDVCLPLWVIWFLRTSREEDLLDLCWEDFISFFYIWISPSASSAHVRSPSPKWLSSTELFNLPALSYQMPVTEFLFLIP